MTKKKNTPSLHALIIGIDCYLKNQLPGGGFYPSLNGCVNDAKNVSQFLRTQLGVPQGNITLLTSSRSQTEGQPVEPKAQWPTYENIIAGFKQLGERAKPGDQVYVHYAGHGGQATTAYPKLKGKDGLDETLVPSDIGNSEARYVRDIEIAHLLQALVDKKLFVTVAFDSCHSGGASRGAGDVAVRGIGVVDTTQRPTQSDVASASVLEQTWRKTQGAAESRSATANSSWLQETTGYVLIAACRSAELANEYKPDGKTVNGALTYWMLDSLKQLGTHLTYRMLHQSVLSRIHGQFVEQTPQVQGEVDRVVFGVDTFALPEARINILAVQGNQFTLNAGQAQGLKQGAKFAVYPIDTLDLAKHEQRLALAELSTVSVVDSIANITKVLDKRRGIQPGDQAVLLNASDIQLSRSVRVVTQPKLPTALAQDKALAQAQKAIKNIAAGWVTLAENSDPVDFQVAINEVGEYEIWDPAGTALLLRPPLKTSDKNAPTQLAQRLIHLTKYRNVQAIVNTDNTSSLAGNLLVELTGTQASFKPGDKPNPTPFQAGDIPTVKTGERLSLRIKNLLPKLPTPPGEPLPNTINVCVLDLTPTWGISKLYPSRTAFEVINPGEERLLTLTLELPDGYQQGVDVLKVFATLSTATTDYDWLTLPELDQPARERGQRSVRSPLDSLFAALSVDKPKSRQARMDDMPSNPWAAVQVEIRVLAKAN